MNISFSWLKQYIDTDISVEEVAKILTDTGLEVEKVEKIETVKGGLEGLLIGEVITKEKHPDADRLNVAEVNVGANETLQIVCGASNLNAGQKVVVATNGTTIYPTKGEPFKIKKSKIRGVESNGMICAEDEIGLGEGHEGIMVLNESAQVGELAKTYFNIEDDYLLEIGLTPNRADAMGHIGVARDLLAALKFSEQKSKTTQLKWPSVENFKTNTTAKGVSIDVKDNDKCPRYAGVTIQGVTVSESPDWLKNRLRSIGLSPINNIVDVTNFVLHELGQPLHAFDADRITGRIEVKTVSSGTKFTTLDEAERSLDSSDLMICDAEKPLCIAGVFGGINSGVSNQTQNIFLESAYFNPVSVRKTAKRHGLNTDASFRFERGIDPSLVIYTLKRAALLIQELAGGEIVGELIDIYPKPISNFNIKLNLNQLNKISGVQYKSEQVEAILESLDIKVLDKNDKVFNLEVPAYRVDVQREIDVIEEVMRIYGFNTIPVPEKVNTSISYFEKNSPQKIQNIVSDVLVANGFLEGMSNSLTSSKYAEKYLNAEHNVELLNALSSDLNVMRQDLLFNTLEAVEYNQNRKNADIKLFEFGSVYHKYSDGYNENKRLLISVSGQKDVERWNASKAEVSYFTIKGIVNQIIERLGINKNINSKAISSDALFEDGEEIIIAKQKVAKIGWVKSSIKKDFDIKQDVFVADFDWDVVMNLMKMNRVKFKPIAKFPSVRRDFSLLLNDEVTFAQLQEIALKCDNKILKEVDLFDVYEGKNLEEGKKSYALSFILQDETKTLTDKYVDKVMSKIQSSFENELGAELR